ncbi:M23 family metallopeptidase [Ruania suaedae]|uniref:M23 family metallopeptidase n=1 Tax=Ruania suaedae TaxID=2897774 RepID=UPI001E56DDF6|nr:M23 family metallopeptidase [Ruania suaedae]UFU02307.1 M23 family metallopeptidase [Ruania suaedae]
MKALYSRRLLILFPSMLILLLLAVFGQALPEELRSLQVTVWAITLAGFAIGLVLAALGTFLAPGHEAAGREARAVRAPVVGRWAAVNSPASKVPSHGVRGYGQAYAIDLVADPDDGRARPAFGGEAFRASQAYPAFGEPVRAMIDGEVVVASGWRRDHRARSNYLTLVYMMLEGMLREIGGPGWIVGNHVTIRGDDGVHALVAHLQQGSLTVGPGERVRAGQVIGRCGNSGNSSEPHVHAQLMDAQNLLTAQGLPMVFSDVRIGDTDPADVLPENEQHMTASA